MDRNAAQIVGEMRGLLQAEYGDRLVKLVLFGSVARGDAEAESDIDVLVVLKGPVNVGREVARLGPLRTDICLRYGAVISCIFMDEDQFLHRNGPLLRNIRREGVAV
jgi:uncharacterized protein